MFGFVGLTFSDGSGRCPEISCAVDALAMNGEHVVCRGGGALCGALLELSAETVNKQGSAARMRRELLVSSCAVFSVRECVRLMW
jgi:hypothetical protein